MYKQLSICALIALLAFTMTGCVEYCCCQTPEGYQRGLDAEKCKKWPGSKCVSDAICQSSFNRLDDIIKQDENLITWSQKKSHMLLASASTWLYDLAPIVYMDNAALSCISECDENSGLCAYINFDDYDDKRNTGKGLRQVYKMIESGQSEIAKKELMSLFSVENDYCNRGDTFISKNGLINEGGACALAILETQNENDNVKINFGKKIQGKLLRESSSFKLVFYEPENTLELVAGSDSPLKGYVGKIVEASANDSRIVLTTTAGCIDISMLN